MVDATTDSHLWAERYDRPLKDIFALQDEITQQIVAVLQVEVQEAELERVRRTPTANLTAYDYFLQGLEYLYRFTKEANARARQMFERAIELDPKYAAAYAALSLTYSNEWILQLSQDPQALERAFELAQKVVILDDSLPLAHRTMGVVYLWKKQYEQAIAAGERSISLDPNNADSYAVLGQILTFAGRPEEAIGVLEKAMRLNPRYPVYYSSNLGRAYRLAGRYEEAIAALKRGFIRNPDYLGLHGELAIIYSELGREEEARAEAAELLRINLNFSLEVVRQRLPFKDPAEVERYLASLRKAGLK